MSNSDYLLDKMASGSLTLTEEDQIIEHLNARLSDWAQVAFLSISNIEEGEDLALVFKKC